MSNKFILVFAITLFSYSCLYFFESYILFRIGKKFSNSEYLDYCLPFYGWILLCRCINLPTWYVIPLFFPFTYHLVCIRIIGKIADRLGKNYWIYGLGSAFFVFPILILAFDRSGTRPERLTETIQAVASDCVSRFITLVGLTGEYTGMEFILPPEGIIIGSDPAVSNIVLTSPRVSDFHARIVPDTTDPQAVIIEDLNSTYGTFYQLVTDISWFPVTTSLTLLLYDKFRVADVSEFEIRLTETFLTGGRS